MVPLSSEVQEDQRFTQNKAPETLLGSELTYFPHLGSAVPRPIPSVPFRLALLQGCSRNSIMEGIKRSKLIGGGSRWLLGSLFGRFICIAINLF